MGTTQQEDRFYWHVVIYREDERFVLHRRKEEEPSRALSAKREERIDLSCYLLAGQQAVVRVVRRNVLLS